MGPVDDSDLDSEFWDDRASRRSTAPSLDEEPELLGLENWRGAWPRGLKVKAWVDEAVDRSPLSSRRADPTVRLTSATQAPKAADRSPSTSSRADPTLRLTSASHAPKAVDRSPSSSSRADPSLRLTSASHAPKAVDRSPLSSSRTDPSVRLTTASHAPKAGDRSPSSRSRANPTVRLTQASHAPKASSTESSACLESDELTPDPLGYTFAGVDLPIQAAGRSPSSSSCADPTTRLSSASHAPKAEHAGPAACQARGRISRQLLQWQTERRQREASECTFQPNLAESARSHQNKAPCAGAGSHRRSEELSEWQREREEKEERECTFHPDLTKGSRHPTRGKSPARSATPTQQRAVTPKSTPRKGRAATPTPAKQLLQSTGSSKSTSSPGQQQWQPEEEDQQESRSSPSRGASSPKATRRVLNFPTPVSPPSPSPKATGSSAQPRAVSPSPAPESVPLASAPVLYGRPPEDPPQPSKSSSQGPIWKRITKRREFEPPRDWYVDSDFAAFAQFPENDFLDPAPTFRGPVEHFNPVVSPPATSERPQRTEFVAQLPTSSSAEPEVPGARSWGKDRQWDDAREELAALEQELERCEAQAKALAVGEHVPQSGAAHVVPVHRGRVAWAGARPSSASASASARTHVVRQPAPVVGAGGAPARHADTDVKRIAGVGSVAPGRAWR